MNAIFCNANTLMDVSLIKELANKGVRFSLITATKKIQSVLAELYGIGSSSVEEYSTPEAYVNQGRPKYLYKKAEYLSILDRYKIIGDLPQETKSAIINRAFDYWIDFLAKNPTDLVIFKMAPHQVYDFVIGELCQELGIKKIVIEKTYWENLVLLQKDYRQNECLKSISPEIIEDIRWKMQAQKKPYWTEAKISNLRRTQRHEDNAIGANRLFYKLRKLIDAKISRPQSGFYDGVYKTKSDLNRLSFRWLSSDRRLQNTNKRILSEYEKSLSDYSELRSQKKIIFYLQCQPEKSTSPLGGEYGNQLLAIERLLLWKPKDYTLVVKEHPSQFSRWQNLDRGRFMGFYTKINDLGCHLVSHTIKNIELFETSDLTVSITGTVVFEAWVMGYRAAYMGFPWYGILEIDRINSKSDLEKALISTTSQQSFTDKVRPLSQFAYKGYADKYAEERFCVENDMKTAAQKMCESIYGYATGASG